MKAIDSWDRFRGHHSTFSGKQKQKQFEKYQQFSAQDENLNQLNFYFDNVCHPSPFNSKKIWCLIFYHSFR